MSLTVVSTPIGNYDDITLRAVESLKNAQVIICEELKPARVLLKRLHIAEKSLWPLNEHSKPQDLTELLEICRTQRAVLISDCGTPAFCDPGAKLVEKCFQEKIELNVNPGPSSLMALIAVAGVELKEFHFVGFLPAEKSTRVQKISALRKFDVPLVVMDTPYRLQATLNELVQVFGENEAVLGVDLTGEKHQVLRAKLKVLAQKQWPKLPFVLLITPKGA